MSEAPSDDPPTTPAVDSRPPGAWWRLPLLLAIVLIAIIAARSSDTRTRGPGSSSAARPQPAADAAGKSVSLTVRYGDDKERKFDEVAWQPGMTVDDLLTDVSRRPDGITYTASGYSETFLVVRIDDTANDRTSGRFWTYSVNDVLADRSAGICELQPGDRVLWTFGREQ
jgi:Domain of unknown function (DUF4430)